VNFLPWSRFLITVSSPACIGNRNHFRTYREQILIGSLVNSKQVNGGALQKMHLYTARLLLYVYVGYRLPPAPTQKNSPDLRQSHEWSLATVGWTVHPSPPRGDAPGRGRSFQTREAATGKARSPTVDNHNSSAAKAPPTYKPLPKVALTRAGTKISH